MTARDATSIRFEHGRTTFAMATGDVVVPVGAGAIAQRLFRHDPPTAGELEQAIDEVEDALTSTGLRHTERGDLQTAEPPVLGLLGLLEPQAGGARVTREEVEMAIDRLASAAMGQPAGPVPGGDGAATLLILRECMHHLGYAGVQRAASAAGP